jgi:PQQ-dependent catabolism-associated beta-propeller protein
MNGERGTMNEELKSRQPSAVGRPSSAVRPLPSYGPRAEPVKLERRAADRGRRTSFSSRRPASRVQRFILTAAGLCLLAACARAPRGPLAYVSNERDGTITVIDTGGDEVVSTIRVGARPRGIRVSPDGRRVYVAVSTPSGKDYDHAENRVAAVDVRSGEIVARYDVGTDPEQLAVHPDGTRLYASNEDAGTASVTEIKSGKQIASLVVGVEPEGVTASPDGRWVYVTAETSNTVSVIDTRQDKVVASFLVDSRPRDAAFSPDGARAYVTTEIGRTVAVVDTAAHKVVHTISVPRGENVKPMGVAVSNDGRRVYVATGRGNTVVVFDAASYEPLATIPVGQRVWGLALTPDGKKLYAANSLSNEVSVIDTATNRVTKTLKAGDGPWGVAIPRN